MARLGLTLNEAKTSLKDARQERFDFLGYSFGSRPLQSERSLVSEREAVQEERATVQDKRLAICWCLATMIHGPKCATR